MNTKSVIDFLEQLANNNNREWFSENKDLYAAARNEVLGFLGKLVQKLVQIDSSIQGFTDPSQALFRIYRDVRFSKNKAPYKTHFGAFFAKGGRTSMYPGYYIHFEPENTLISGGTWCPDPPLLKKIRQEIYYNGEALVKILEKPKFKKLFPGLDDQEKLKRIPAGYPSDFEYEDFLKYKHYTVSAFIPENILFSDKLESYILDVFETLQPFNAFFQTIIDEEA
ncbi:MAG: DUF2461 domain-containing protein [Bacteroidales bacterium]|jgi:uncharacterized protein (TIGR02453 family)|nr:DUF2461 domain-containing protein [Bacteroidales bacterium]